MNRSETGRGLKEFPGEGVCHEEEARVTGQECRDGVLLGAHTKC